MEIIILQPIVQPIKVEKGVPVPERKVLYSIFPFHEMEVGDSFLVERGRFGKKYFALIRQLIYAKAKEYKLETGHDARFITTIDRAANGVRCFRIE